MTIRYDK